MYTALQKFAVTLVCRSTSGNPSFLMSVYSFIHEYYTDNFQISNDKY